MVDPKLCGLLGTWQHVTLPLRALCPGSFREGLGLEADRAFPLEGGVFTPGLIDA